MQAKYFLAFDLGATSGRTILGTLCGNKLEIKELTRFPNQIMQVGKHHCWNIFELYKHITDGLKAAAKEKVEITSIGIDTWGVDFAFVGADGTVMGLPNAYRDPHTDGAPEEFFEKIMPRKEVYDLTGIQIMNFNSLYQLYALKRDKSSQLAASEKLMFMPDALSYMLTGDMVTEYTIASTSQILNPRTKKMEEKLLAGLGLNSLLFAPLVMPGTKIGTLLPSIAAECGVPQIPVIAVAGHDTASAVAAVPALNEKFAYLSSGTWSLMGIEVKDPVITDRTSDLNITNEGGVEGTTRLLKNITGMWILEQCLKEWKAAGKDYTYVMAVQASRTAPEFKAFINPDHKSFAHPASMTKAICDYCQATGQAAPQTDPEFMRVIFESLALKYRETLDAFKTLAPFEIEKLHIIGGGSKNDFLNEFTANSTGVEVIAGPDEATAIGNIMIQAKAAGITDSLAGMRKIISETVVTKTFKPSDTEKWNKAYEKYKLIIN